MLANGAINVNKQVSIKNENQTENSENVNENNKEDNGKILPIDFTLYDQYGKEHTLSEYKGKTIFLNFWATWCPPCREEMPYIDELYEEYNKNQDDVIILGVASPNLGREGSEDDVKKFLSENYYKFPVVFDEGGPMIIEYGISAFPSTLIIDKEGFVSKYIPGAMDKETMKSLIEAER